MFQLQPKNGTNLYQFKPKSGTKPPVSYICTDIGTKMYQIQPKNGSICEKYDVLLVLIIDWRAKAHASAWADKLISETKTFLEARYRKVRVIRVTHKPAQSYRYIVDDAATVRTSLAKVQLYSAAALPPNTMRAIRIMPHKDVDFLPIKNVPGAKRSTSQDRIAEMKPTLIIRKDVSKEFQHYIIDPECKMTLKEMADHLS